MAKALMISRGLCVTGSVDEAVPVHAAAGPRQLRHQPAALLLHDEELPAHTQELRLPHGPRAPPAPTENKSKLQRCYSSKHSQTVYTKLMSTGSNTRNTLYVKMSASSVALFRSTALALQS